MSVAWYTVTMPGVRQIDLQLQIASTIRTARMALGWSQRELARRIGSNQSAIRRLESSTTRLLDVALASAAMTMLGIVVSLDGNGPAIAVRMEQRDAVHARCVAYVVRRLEREGWLVAIEVEIGSGRFRGWVDVLAYHPTHRALLVIEVKTVLDDVGRLLRTLGWYTRSSREAAVARGWRPLRITRLVAVLASDEADARIGANRDLIGRELPGDADAMLTWIGDPAGSVPRGTAALIDPLSRRARWLVRPRGIGRRSRAPYRDYRDAAARLAPAPPRERESRRGARTTAAGVNSTQSRRVRAHGRID
jgi:transcriptional regulator with XRE-family HTH domain